MVALASPAASNVSGQIFTIRGNEIFLMSQPRPIRGMTRLEGWTPQSVVDHALPAMAGQFVDLGPTASVFTWEPV